MASSKRLSAFTEYEGRQSWKDWLDAAGASEVDTRGGLHFNHVALALGAAIEGQGVVLSLRPLAEDDLAAGRLVIPFDIALDLDFAYYIISPSSDADSVAVDAFRDWLIEEAA